MSIRPEDLYLEFYGVAKLLYFIYNVSIAQKFMLRLATDFGVAAAACFYSGKLKMQVRGSTVTCIKKAYLDGVRSKRRGEDDGEVSSLPRKKCG